MGGCSSLRLLLSQAHGSKLERTRNPGFRARRGAKRSRPMKTRCSVSDALSLVSATCFPLAILVASPTSSSECDANEVE